MNAHAAQLIRLQKLSRHIKPRPRGSQKEVERLRAEIPEQFLRSFDRLAQQGRMAVAMISESGACGSCHLNLPPATAIRIRHTADLIHCCPHCGCFLYDPTWVAPVALADDGAAPVSAALRSS